MAGGRLAAAGEQHLVAEAGGGGGRRQKVCQPYVAWVYKGTAFLPGQWLSLHSCSVGLLASAGSGSNLIFCVTAFCARRF